MINEVLEVEGYMQGETKIYPSQHYRAIYMICKYMLERDYQKREIREYVKGWMKRNGVQTDYYINNIINAASANKRMLRGETEVRISKSDRDRIVELFDSKITRRLALAMLCYAKVAGDENGDFQIQSTALSQWLNVQANNIRGKYMKELIDMEYVQKVTAEHKRKQQNRLVVNRPDGWRQSGQVETTRQVWPQSEWYRILETYGYAGQWKLEGNDIRGLAEQVFENT